VVPKDKFTIKGPTKSWAGLGSSGKAVHRLFCSECGSPIAHDPDAAPEIIAIKAGTLDTEIKKTLQPVSTAGDFIRDQHIEMYSLGYRNLDCQQTALLQGELGASVRAHAPIIA
jgi:hypothetical protein